MLPRGAQARCGDAFSPIARRDLGRFACVPPPQLHLYLEDGKLKCTGIVRMQNANVRAETCGRTTTRVARDVSACSRSAVDARADFCEEHSLLRDAARARCRRARRRAGGRVYALDHEFVLRPGRDELLVCLCVSLMHIA